jgi:GT2 family glycosyltransferase
MPIDGRGPLLSVSIVVFRSDLGLLARCLDALDAALDALRTSRRGADDTGPFAEVHVVDNGPGDYSAELAPFLAARSPPRSGVPAAPITGHGNLGYGRGNNLVIARTAASYHLVLNPDAELAPDALVNGVSFMERHADVGLVAATSVSPDGETLNLCKGYPSLAVLAMRALPRALAVGPFGRRLAAYDLRAAPGGVTDVTGAMVSGSFMLFRTAPLRAIGGFDPAYFLYFEDFDLAYRIGRVARVVWLSDVRVLHHGGHASRKGWTHRRHFARGALRFFSTHGWRLW